MFIIIDSNDNEIDRVKDEWDAKEICFNHNYGLPECEQIGYYEDDGFYDEVGGYHACGIGWNPNGIWCGECMSSSCKDCSHRDCTEETKWMEMVSNIRNNIAMKVKEK